MRSQSIDLTRLPLPPKLPTSQTVQPAHENVEYSSREIKPTSFLLRDLLRSHSIFLLHHGSSLSALFVRSKRSKFVSLLGRYWDLFLSTWNVMLHGNPIRSMFGGINVAASGELGMGVGEEDRGSGEREVLEGLVGRIEGLVDLVVSKFGSQDDDIEAKGGQEKGTISSKDAPQWLGTGQEPNAEDGAIFLGAGALSRKSLRDVTNWMEDVYSWGENAYGVIDSPTSTRQARRQKKPDSSSKAAGQPDAKQPAGKSAKAKELAARKLSAREDAPSPPESSYANANPVEPSGERSNDTGDGAIDKLVTFMKLGYGTYWSLGHVGEPSTGTTPQSSSAASNQDPKKEDTDAVKESRSKLERMKVLDDASGHYLIGLMGEVEEAGAGSDLDEERDSEDPSELERNSRTMLRTMHIELESERLNRPDNEVVHDFGSPFNELPPSMRGRTEEAQYFDSQDRNKAKKLRVVVYVNRPFIFTFLFHLHTDSLAWDSLYRSLHYQLAPLRKPLLSSTAFRPERPNVGPGAAGIYDLIWDPRLMTVHSTIPSIPDPGQQQQATGAGQQWSRVEAMNTHIHLLNIHAATRPDLSELERTCKTNRGWWVVWTRIVDKPTPPRRLRRGSSGEDDEDGDDSDSQMDGNLATIREDEGQTDSAAGMSVATHPRKQQHQREAVVSKEIYLIRRASDHVGFRGVSSSYAEGGSSWAEGPGRLAQGIGVDTRKYIEGLLSLSR
jgi:hypothetical protein